MPPFGGVVTHYHAISVELKPRTQDFDEIFRVIFHSIFAAMVGFLILERLYEMLTLVGVELMIVSHNYESQRKFNPKIGVFERLRSLSFLCSAAILGISRNVYHFWSIPRSLPVLTRTKKLVRVESICLFYDLYRAIAIDIEEILSCDPESDENPDDCYLYSYAYRQKHFEYLKSFLQFITTLQFYKFLYDFKVKFKLRLFIFVSVESRLSI